MSADLTLGVTIGAAMASSWKAVVGTVKTDLSKLGQELQRSTRTQRDIGKMAGLQSTVEGTRRQLMDARREAEKFRLQMALAGDQGAKAQERAQRQWDKSKARVEALTGRLARQQEQTQRLGASLRKAGVDTKDLSTANEKLAATIDQQTAAFLKQKNLIESREQHRQGFLQQAAKLGGAIILTRKATGAAMDFESAMADVRKVVDFDSSAQMNRMGDSIQRMAGYLGMDAVAIAQIVAAGGQANIAREDLLKFAEDAGKMGVAFDMSADEAGQMMAQWRTGLELTQDGVRDLADQINYLGNTGPASAAKISGIVTRIGALGDVAGLSGSAIAALGSTITGVGISEEIASTGIKNLMLTLTQGRAATDKQKASFRALGMSAEDVASRMQDDAGGAIMDVLAAIRELDKTDQAAILTQLFGRESVAAIAPLLKNLEQLEGNFKKVSDATKFQGSMEAEFEARMDTTRETLGSLGRVLGRTATIIGNVFLPPIKLGAEILITVFDAINEAATAMPFLTTVVVSAATAWASWGAATSAVKFGLTFMPGPIMRLVGLLPGLSTVLSVATAAVRAFNIAMLANPIVLIGAAIAGAAFLIYKYWKPISAFFGGVFDGIWSAIEPVRVAFSEAFAPVAPIFSAIGNVMRPVISWFKDLLSPVDATGESLERAASIGKTVGSVLGTAFRVINLPLEIALKLIGSILERFQRAVEFGRQVARFFGIGDAEPTPASASAAASISKAVAKAPITTSQKPVQDNSVTETKFEIYGSPGQSPEEIAEIVAQKMAELQRTNAARRRSSLYDQE